MTWTVLHEACQHHDTQRVIDRCSMGYAIDEIVQLDDHGSNPLHLACWGNPPIELIQALLIVNTPNIPTTRILMDQDRNGNTPLHIACAYPQTDASIIELMLFHHQQQHDDEDLWEEQEDGYGATSTYTTAVQRLLSIRNKEGCMPLHMACRYHNNDLPSSLSLSSSVSFHHNKERIIQYMIDAYPGALRSRIRMGTAVLPRKKTNRQQRSRQPNKPGEEKEGRSSIQHHTHMSNYTHFVAHSSTVSGMSLEHYHDNDYSGNTKGFLVGEQPEQIRDGAYPLHMAISSGASIPTIEMLLHYHGAKDVLSLTNKFGETPLHVAISNHHDPNDPNDPNGNDHGHAYFILRLQTLLRFSTGKTALQIQERRHGNLPIHSLVRVITMLAETTPKTIPYRNGIISTVQSMLEYYPESLHIRNHQGKTPHDILFSNAVGLDPDHTINITNDDSSKKEEDNDGNDNHSNNNKSLLQQLKVLFEQIGCPSE